MASKVWLFLILFIYLILLNSFVSAEEEPICARVKGRCVPCEKYHRSFSVRFENLTIDKLEYLPGETIFGSFDIVGAIEHPMSEGKIKIQVLTYFRGSFGFGEDVVDEFFIPDEISFKTYSQQHVDFNWKIPNGLPSGRYKIAFYYYMSSYSLGGHSDVTGLYSTGITFKVKESNDVSYIYFDRTAVFVNETQYNPNFFLPEYEYGIPLTIKIPLKNIGKAKDVIVTKRIYLWDDVKYPRLLELNKKGAIPENSPIIAELKAVSGLQKTEEFEIGADSTKDIKYELGLLPPEAYMVIITAENKATQQKSVMPIRVPIHGTKARIAFASIAKFPLAAGESTTIGACFSISTTIRETLSESVYVGDGKEPGEVSINDFNSFSTLGSIEFEFQDESGKSLLHETVKPILIIDEMRAVEVPFKAEKNLSRGKLITKLWDINGRLHDIEETYYDYSKYADVKMKLNINCKFIEDGPKVAAEIELVDDIGSRCKLEKNVNLIVINKKDLKPITTKTIKLSDCVGNTEVILPIVTESYIIRAVLAENNSITAEAEIKSKEIQETPNIKNENITPGIVVKDVGNKGMSMSMIIGISFATFALVALLSLLLLKYLRQKKVIKMAFLFILLSIFLGLMETHRAAEIDGFQLFCPTTPDVADPACWESYVKAYMRISWEPTFTTLDGKVISGNVLYCEGEGGQIKFDMNSSVSGDFMIAGGYTSCPPIAWKKISDYDKISSWDMFYGHGINEYCNANIVQPQLILNGKSYALCNGCQIGVNTLENITCEDCLYSPTGKYNVLGQPLEYKCAKCTVPSGQPQPAGQHNNIPCYTCRVTTPGSQLSTWNIFCKGNVKIYENNSVKQSFDITSAPPSTSFNVPAGASEYKIKATLDVDCLGYSGYFLGFCWNRPHYVKLNSYSRSPGPVGLPPYKNLLPATLSGEVTLNVVDPNTLFNTDKIEISDVTHTRFQTTGGWEKVITKFRVTNTDKYPVKIDSIELKEPKGQLSVIQGKGIILKPGEATDVIIESIVFTIKPRIDIYYSYNGYTISCKKNQGIKSITFDLFPNEVYAIKSLNAKNTKVGEPIEVSVTCTADLNLKISLWPTDGTIKGSKPVLQNIKMKCNKDYVAIGTVQEPGVYYIEAELDIPGYSICKTSDCKQGKYISVVSQPKETAAAELNIYFVLIIAIVIMFITKIKERKS
ncbi:MAG: hypothetical protein N3F05_01345 [Candidatus Diapherotrites archaeon]|nr:hypothetical protein [Candidatus Diapherotrites archaeon]